MNALARELKRGSTEVFIVALVEEPDRHGYELATLIDERSNGASPSRGVALPDAVPHGEQEPHRAIRVP